MSAFKKLKKSDVIVVPHFAHKSWAISASNLTPTSSEDPFATYDIQFFKGTGTPLSETIFDPNTDITSSNGEYERLVYRSMKHLYYHNFLTASLQESGSYDNFNQSTILNYRKFPSSSLGIAVISIPQKIFGTKVKPHSFKFTGSFQIVPTGSNEFDLQDDGNGNIYDYITDPPLIAGNIIYSHGLVILNDSYMSSGSYRFEELNYNTTNANLNANMAFKNEQIIYENEIRCLARESEFNYTQNPTAATGGLYRDNITGSEFQPYVTTIGLYNEANELLAVGKSPQPIPMSPSTDMTFVIRYDT